MNITFLYHSSFLVELSGCTLLFDWYGGPVPDYDRSKPLYVFASHHHGDHYAPEIFAQLGMDNVWYVLANCIRLSAKRKAASGLTTAMCSAWQQAGTFPWEGWTYKPTAPPMPAWPFWSRSKEKPSSTQGTLHWWHWAEEDAAWNQAMERDFKKECAKLQGKPVDVGFFVLDPRQEGEFWWGFDWWMRTMEVKHAFPMHSWEDYTLVQTFRTLPCSAPYRDRW